MEQSFGRTSEPTTEAEEADAGERDEDTALTDPEDALQHGIDPLDAHQPSRESNDPLDPDGHVI